MGLGSVLIVEDESVVALDIEESLLRIGYEVSGTVASGEAALSAVSETPPDIVLMDIRLQGALDGIETAEQLRERYKLPIVYLTAHADRGTLERAKVTEPYGYILKPFDEVELGITLEFALYKHRLQYPAEAATTVAAEPQSNLQAGGSSDSEVASELSSIAVLKNVPLEDIAALASHASSFTAQNAKTLVYEGEESSAGYIVLRGRLALLKSSASGRELIVDFIEPGDMYGMFLGLQGGCSEFSVRAQTETKAIAIPASSIVYLVDRNPSLYRELLSVIGGRLRASHATARALAHDKVDARIARALCRLISDSEEGSGSEIRVTRQELANLAGSTVETAIRVTKAMERADILDLPDPGIIRITDLESLQQMAAGEAS